MIVDTITSVYQFRDAFTQANRGTQFSYEGLEVLFDYLEELSDSIGEPYELDVIALCCDYAEDTPLSIAEDYSIEIDENENDDEIMQQVREYLEDKGVFVGETSSTILYQQF
jgi:hypothetical protein